MPRLILLPTRSLAILAAILFVTSTVFPVAASLSRDADTFARTWGIVDVALAFAVVLMVIVLTARVGPEIDAQSETAAYRAYRVLFNGILVLLVVFFVCGDRITWRILLPGLAWRSWLLLFALPAWLAAMRTATPR